MTTASANHPVLAALRGIVGNTHVLVDGDLSAFEQDWRRRHRGRALAVVRPGSTREVAAVVRACSLHGVPLVPQGGNTGLVNGSVPDASGTQVLLSMGRMNRVREIDQANLTMTVEAGCVLQAVQAAAEQAALLFPLSLAAEGSCTIGGNLATNAGGTQVLRYGNARELCLGLEVVTASGEIWSGLSGLRKDNTGYDLRDLFIGSEGTLGVITAATLKLYPRPAAVMTALASCDSLAQASALLRQAQDTAGPALTAFEVMNTLSLELVRRHFPDLRQPLPAAPWTVLLELSDSENASHARGVLERLLETALDSGLATDAVVAENLQQSHDIWHLRETITLAQAQEGLNVRHDIALPISRIPAFCDATDQAIAQAFPGIRLVNFGHLGDGNLHYNFLAPEQADSTSWIRLHEGRITSMVYAAATGHGGSISAEHGIGIVKRDALMLHKSPVAMNLMNAIKNALDPNGLLNPGCVLASSRNAHDSARGR
ncbi:FAD-binding oxidoreductase [Lacisediminimonas profundi]|uniref:FAD-binding oxidoreductase n=1 Tax=Lacisediminimonas profundi TaxID=2603856 RepID=UPI00124B0FEE|nr:FAD-binding oxidoreductase [Lacisediminimonas profundi]